MRYDLEISEQARIALTYGRHATQAMSWRSQVRMPRQDDLRPGRHRAGIDPFGPRRTVAEMVANAVAETIADARNLCNGTPHGYTTGGDPCACRCESPTSYPEAAAEAPNPWTVDAYTRAITGGANPLRVAVTSLYDPRYPRECHPGAQAAESFYREGGSHL